MENIIRNLFGASIEFKSMAAELLSEHIAKTSTLLVNCLLNNGKLLLCGNGGSAANCMHFSTALLNHFEGERPGLPVIPLTEATGVLTALGQEGHADQFFARQIQALGQSNDVLIILTSTGNPMNLLNAVHAAHDQGMDVIALSGRDGGILASHLGPEDIELRAPGDTAAQIREIHLFVLHCFCDLIDRSLFNQLLG